jgi:tripartite-type tricarboxylate transporter receptor subunit TctC
MNDGAARSSRRSEQRERQRGENKMDMTRASRSASLIASVGLFCAAIGSAQAQTSFFAGKTISLVVASPPGGGYDALARVLAVYLPAYVPGRPKVVVQNMPGAGGITEMNYLYTTAPRDGTVIGSVQNSVPFEPLFGDKQEKYDSRKFIYLGTPNTETDVLAAWRGSSARSIADLKTSAFTLGSTGAKSNPSIWAEILSETLGLKFKTVVGYPGQDDILLGMERREVEGTFIFYNSLKATKPSWVKNGDVRILVQIGGSKNPKLPDVPLATDLVAGAADKLLVQAAAAPLSLGRPYLLPPGAPPDRAAALRHAMSAAFADPGFAADIAKLDIDAGDAKTGEQLQDIIAAAYATPSTVRKRLVDILNP